MAPGFYDLRLPLVKVSEPSRISRRVLEDGDDSDYIASQKTNFDDTI